MVKNLPTDAGDTKDVGLILGLGRSPGEGNGNPLQYSCLEDSHEQRSLVGYSLWGRKELARENSSALSTHLAPQPRWSSHANAPGVTQGLPAPLPDVGLTPSCGADGVMPTQSRGSPSQVHTAPGLLLPWRPGRDLGASLGPHPQAAKALGMSS